MVVGRRRFIQFAAIAIGGALTSSHKAIAALSSIDLQGIKDLYLPTHRKFHELKNVFNLAIKKPLPLAISQPESSNQFSTLLKNESLKETPILMRSGGHSYACFSTGSGVVCDVRKFKEFIVSPDRKSIRLGAGLQLREALALMEENGFTFPAGEYPSVSVAGYFLGGGHSRRSRLLGIGADVVKSMTVVLANGKRLKDISPTNHSDLYWALLGGGGGNFAIVESFTIDAIPAFNDYFFKFIFNGKYKEEIFKLWQEGIAKDPSNHSVNLTMYVRDGFVYKLIVSGLFMQTNEDLETNKQNLESSHWGELLKFGSKKFTHQIQSCNRIKQEGKPQMAFKGSSHYADNYLNSKGIKTFFQNIKSHTRGTSIYLGLYPLMGQVQSPKRSNAYPHRSSNYILDMFSEFRDDSKAELFKNNFDNLHKAFNPLFSGRSYVNYPDLSLGEDWPRRYYGKSLEKLLNVKQKYDPNHRFNYGKHSLSSLLT